MSFGFEDENDLIDAALDNAIDGGKLIIAAASNNGGLSGRARPARQEGVICIHATDGKGNKGGMNPSPMTNRDNFATLGVAVPSRWKGKDVWKSGTSFAVPIAAGFAADVLEFAKYRCTNLRPRKLKILHQKRGMQAIFRKMAEERDGYDFIHPVRLWKDWQDIKTERQAAKEIETIMEDL
jgi:Subtilase family